MSELREADQAVQERQESITEAMSEATGLDRMAVYRHLFIGMDLDVPEVRDLAEEHAVAGCLCALEEGPAVDLAVYLAAAWLDGFSVASMLWMRRREGNTR